jgi:hypothetical protein
LGKGGIDVKVLRGISMLMQLYGLATTIPFTPFCTDDHFVGGQLLEGVIAAVVSRSRISQFAISKGHHRIRNAICIDAFNPGNISNQVFLQVGASHEADGEDKKEVVFEELMFHKYNSALKSGISP